MRLSASQLSSFSRCQLAYFYDRQPGATREVGSATSYGSVWHHAVHVMERMWSTPLNVIDADARDKAVATFNHYWQPENITEVAEPVSFYYPRQTWAGLRARGEKTLRDYADLRSTDDAKVLALEYPFEVAIPGTDHTISGFVDKLTVRYYRRKAYISVEDFKTGYKPTYLRHHIQGHVYCFASTQRAFWDGFDDGDAWYEATKDWSRKFLWIDAKTVAHSDGGWRDDQDYRRLALMVNGVARVKESGNFVPTLTGDVCQYCPHRSYCGDIGLPEDNQGAPA